MASLAFSKQRRQQQGRNRYHYLITGAVTVAATTLAAAATLKNGESIDEDAVLSQQKQPLPWARSETVASMLGELSFWGSATAANATVTPSLWPPTTTTTTRCEASSSSSSEGGGGGGVSFLGRISNVFSKGDANKKKSSLNRQNTMYRLHEQAEKDSSLESSYLIDWKHPIGEGGVWDGPQGYRYADQ